MVQISSEAKWRKQMIGNVSLWTFWENGERHIGVLLPRQAVGLGAPQTIIRRPLTSPDRHNNSVHVGCSRGRLGASSWQTVSSPTSCLQLLHRHPPMCSRKHLDQNNKIIITHRSPRKLGFFHFSKLFFHHFFLVYIGEEMITRTSGRDCIWRSISIQCIQL